MLPIEDCWTDRKVTAAMQEVERSSTAGNLPSLQYYFLRLPYNAFYLIEEQTPTESANDTTSSSHYTH